MSDFTAFPEIGLDRKMNNAERVSMGQDSNLWVDFYIRAVKSEAESKKAGRPMYINKEYVKIFVPADRNTVVDRPAHDGDRERFPRQYANFQNKRSNVEDGTPLEQWTAMDPASLEMFRDLKVYTVEVLAAMNDSQIGKVGMGCRDWVIKAKAYLQAASDSALPQKLAVELAQRDEDMKSMKAQLDEQAAIIKELRENGSKPRKAAA